MAGRNLRAADVLIVIHDFDARSGDELTLRRGERVQLIELDDGFEDGWFLGRHLGKGTTGLFPGVYTSKLPASTASTSATNQLRSGGQVPSSYNIHTQTTTSPPTAKIPQTSPASTNEPLAVPLPVEKSNVQGDGPRASLPVSHHTSYVQRTIGETLREDERGSDSPVMNETLNVIDEHITDLATPRQSLAPMRHRGDDSASDYSSHLERHSYLDAADTEDESQAGPDEATVKSWDHIKTAQHLRSIGVDEKHCDIFEEQEITGDVLLDMDQNFVYMKEFDFGVMGRRLKTWHKIRDFQNEVKSRPALGKRASARNRPNNSGNVSHQTSGLSLRQPGGIPDPDDERDDVIHPLQPSQQPKRTSWAGRPLSNLDGEAETPARANTSMSHRSRRHSSIDFGAQPDLELSSVAGSSHHKQPSLDKSWSMAGSTQATTPTSSIRPSAKNDDVLAPTSPAPIELPSLENDRGYFSSNDMENRKVRNRLSRNSRTSHLRQSSMAETSSKRASHVSGFKKHNRLSSVGSVAEETSPNLSDAPRAYSQLKKGRFRSSSARNTPPASYTSGTSPAVTILENDSNSNVGSPAVEKMRMQDRAKKLMGFRTASDSVTASEKSDLTKTHPSMDTMRSSDIVASPGTGDTSPSATPSLDIETPDGTDVASSLTKTSTRKRPLTKQQTSAYTHGLLKLSPAEARASPMCKHHGWMKKKSSGLMTTWKPRLFILQGRRLSYYYSENDTEERGVIDISGHKVLVANDDPMVTLHASVTGASKAQSTPQPDREAVSPKPSTPTGVFYFKLVPPRTGMSRAVQFTKPAVHYFQCDTISQGRKWMGEIMKATIEHELGQFETTNRQKTIPLKVARARRERPPALDDTKGVEAPAKIEIGESGLGIDIAADPPGATSPKALSLLGLAAKPSFHRTDTDKDLPAVPQEEEDKENKAQVAELPADMAQA